MLDPFHAALGSHQILPGREAGRRCPSTLSGGPEMRNSSEMVIANSADAIEAPVSVRSALSALLGRLSPEAAPGQGELTPPDAEDAPPKIASSFENRLRTVRANAFAAYDSVEGGDHAAALGAALALVEAEWFAARAQRDAYAEALKTIRLYGRDARSRAQADHALATRPEVLACAIDPRTATFSRAAGSRSVG